MSTRSMIAFDNGDELYAIYCHFDGYPQNVGRILLKHYDDIELVEELIDLGNLSILRPEIGEKQDFDNVTNKNWCLAYGRDRGEPDQEAGKYISLTEAEIDFGYCDYFYVFDGQKWLYKRYGVKAWSELDDEACS